MPSLSALREFKASFDNIGDEKANIAAKGLPFDNFELPDFEPEPLVIGAADDEDEIEGISLPDDFETPTSTDEMSAEPEASAGDGEFPSFDDDFDFGALLGAGPDNLPLPPSHDEIDSVETAGAELTSIESNDIEKPVDNKFDLDAELATLDMTTPQSSEMPPEISAEAPETTDQGIDDFSIPDGLLSDLPDEMESSLPDFQDFPVESKDAQDTQEDQEPAAETGDSLDLGELSDDLLADTLDSEDINLGDLPDFSAFDESTEPTATDDGFDLGYLPDIGISDDTAKSAVDDENLDLGDLPDFGASDESAAANDSLDLGDLSDFGISDDAAEPAAADDFDLGDLSGISTDDTFDLDTGESDAEFGQNEMLGEEDFSLPGLDDLLINSEENSVAADSVPADISWNKKKASIEDAPENIDDILLDDNDLDNFLKNLSGYPLNLRLACEELIAEQMVAPDKMAKLIWLLTHGAPAKETAELATEISGKPIIIPKGYERRTGEAFEAEQASFAYVFVHYFFPILRIFLFIAAVSTSLFYLSYRFIYTPLKAESIYKIGYERIFAGEYQRANERFTEAFGIHRNKKWFYTYAEAFRDERQYRYAEEKYDELLRYFPRDKKGVLDYANLETNYLRNYDKAERLLRHELLDYAPDDPDGLLALGDNSLAWGEIEPSKYEDARYNYARLLEKYGWTDPVVERMMKYFIRTDNLKEVLPLKAWFDNNSKRSLSAATLAELGGYFLDKQLEEVRGVRDEYVEYITGVRDLLLQAVQADPSLPESHYHLARYYHIHSLDGSYDERVTLETAIRAFDNAKEETIRRLDYRIDTHQRYADLLINSKEFLPAEEQLVKGINLYEDALSRRLISRSLKYGKLYAGLGDLEYFTKTGDMEQALSYYRRAEQNGWAPPEMRYRMGAAWYQLENWKNALEYFFAASSELPLNRRLLFALGNASLKQGDYFVAQGYYNRLLDILEVQRTRLSILLPNDRPEYLELAERLMMTRNNAGVAHEALANQTGDRSYRTRAMSLYAESNRAWDSLTRDPLTMIRSGSTPLPYLNSRNTLYPQPEYEPQIFIRIDKDGVEPSNWEKLVPLTGLE